MKREGYIDGEGHDLDVGDPVITCDGRVGTIDQFTDEGRYAHVSFFNDSDVHYDTRDLTAV